MLQNPPLAVRAIVETRRSALEEIDVPSKLTVDVSSVPLSGLLTALETPPTDRFAPGGKSTINLIRAQYRWPVIVDYLRLLPSGGSLGNLTALLAMRQAAAGFDVWSKGAHAGPPLAVITSTEAHYSVARTLRIMGWGDDGVIIAPVDDKHRLTSWAVEQALKQARERKVIGIVAAAGSTATGAFDPLDELADVAQRRGLWLHVDAAHGGGVALSLGHRHLAFVGGPEHNHDARERLRGFRDAIAAQADAHGIEYPGDFDEASGHRAGGAIVQEAQRPDAVFAANDMMALGCLYAFAQAGVRVPEDIALAGFDDIPLARFVHPSLTTMRVSIAGLGGRAMTRLLAQIEADAASGEGEGDEPAGPDRHVLAPELVVRASTAAAATETHEQARRSPRTKRRKE